MSKTVLVTGGAARVGAEIARGLSRDGWTVIIHYFRSETKAIDLVAELNSEGGQAYRVQGNLSVPQDCDTLISRASDIVGQPLLALINNASTFKDDSADNFSRGSYDFHMEANLRAPLILAQKFVEQASSDASIINIIDHRVLKPNPLFFTYSLSKAALHWATKTMAQSYAPKVRVNAIGPGPVLKNTQQTPEEFAKEASETLLGKASPPDSIVQAVRYLLAAESVTGQFLAVDSGQHLRWETPDLIL